MQQHKEIMTAKEVAAYFNIHLLTVHKYAREGKIPAFKIGGEWRYKKEEIKSWVGQRR